MLIGRRTLARIVERGQVVEVGGRDLRRGMSAQLTNSSARTVTATKLIGGDGAGVGEASREGG